MSIPISYTDDFEKLLKTEAEESECMSLLHMKCHEKFNRFSVYINVPVIIVSSIIGFLSPMSLFNQQDVFLGSLSIFIGILKTVDSYFDITRRSETHRMTCLNYLRISRWIRLQLSLQRACRISPKDLYDLISHDLQNIREAEPLVPPDVVRNFNAQYADHKETTSKPAITTGLTAVVINDNETAPAPAPVPVASEETHHAAPHLHKKVFK